jgi:hypothetical protein
MAARFKSESTALFKGAHHRSGGPFDGNPKQEHFHATVISQSSDDPFNEDQRLAKGLNRLIAILRDKLNSLQSGNSTQS